jgi:hypothetical protein
VISFCLLVAVLFVLRPPASQLKKKVLGSIGAALGRNVEVSSVHLRFLPRPAFELEDLVIHDDPLFGAEPLLRAPEVTASLQVAALLHGHIQISSLSLSDASLNLARNSAGQWNVEDLLQRTSSIAVAPTGSGRHAPRPAFPYIEASNTRINFKSGAVKTHFAFTDAKFSLWQDSENAWGVRLRARPMRTDSNLTDAGMVNVSGTWQRSAVLHATPLQFSFEWKDAQIGQISKLLYGIDKGWRGSALVSGDVAGTPESLKIRVAGSVDDFRRRDVLEDKNMRLAAHCFGEYSFTAMAVSNLQCIAPSGDGSLQLTGSASGEPNSTGPFSTYDVRLVAKDVRAQSALSFIRHANANLGGDVLAEGHADWNLQLSRTPVQPLRIQGNGALRDLRLSAASGGDEVVVRAIPFSVAYGLRDVEPKQRGAGIRSSRMGKRIASDSRGVNSAEPPQIEVGPFDMLSGRSNSVQVHAWLSKDGYQASVRGDAGIRRLLQSARMMGIAAPSVNAEGSSTVDLTVAGAWNGDPPTISGTAQLHSVQAAIRGVNEPVHIATANLVISDDEVKVLHVSGSAADATWRGSMRISRPCATPKDCRFQFNLRTPQLSAAGLNKYLNPALQKRSWYKFLSITGGKPSYLLQARAGGKITVDKLVLGNTSASHFTTELRLEDGRITLSGLNAELFGGTVSGDWQADFTSKPPAYRGSGDLEKVSLADVSELMHDGWIQGTGDIKYQLIASGSNLRDVLDSASLNGDFSISDATFPHIVLTSRSGPLQAETFSGSVQLHEGEFSFDSAKLETENGVYNVSGTASSAGALNLKLIGEASSGFTLSGTVLETRVSANSTTAASLKP